MLDQDAGPKAKMLDPTTLYGHPTLDPADGMMVGSWKGGKEWHRRTKTLDPRPQPQTYTSLFM